MFAYSRRRHVTNFSQDYDITANHLVTQTVHVYTFTHKTVIVKGCPLTFVMIFRPHPLQKNLQIKAWLWVLSLDIYFYTHQLCTASYMKQNLMATKTKYFILVVKFSEEGSRPTCVRTNIRGYKQTIQLLFSIYIYQLTHLATLYM